MEIREAPSLGGHAVEIRRGVVFLAECTDVAVAHVVAENDDDIRRTLGGGGIQRCDDEEEENEGLHTVMRARTRRWLSKRGLSKTSAAATEGCRSGRENDRTRNPAGVRPMCWRVRIAASM